MSVLVYHENPSGQDAFIKSGDSWLVDESNFIFAVADSPLRALTRYFRKYPQADVGYRAASTFCESCADLAIDFLNSGDFGEAQMREVLAFANQQIGLINSEIGRDPKDLMNYDLAETVGVNAVISNDRLYYGLLEDCYINVLRGNNYEDVLDLDYQIMKAKKYMDKQTSKSNYLNSLNDSFKDRVPETYWYEPFWCCNLRNNSELFDSNGSIMGWGCFDGEPSAEEFFQVGSIELEVGDHIILFSDGMIPFLERDDCFKWFIQNVNPTYEFEQELRDLIMEISDNTKDIDSEKTLIYFKWEG